jgi:hypothetical protein
MNMQERILVNRLVTRIAQLPEAPRDPDVQLEIDALLRLRPDAPYWLAQRVLLLEAALEQAQARAAQPAAVQPPMPTQPAQPVQPAAMQPGAFAPAAPQQPTAPSGAGSFLRNAASVGAGVLGGSLLFQGIESLLHGGSHHGVLGAGQGPVEIIESTTNNFIDPGLLDASSVDGGSFDVGGDPLADGGESWL